jgi:ABC-2 type transport system permease protein
MALAYLCGLLMYMLVFVFGTRSCVVSLRKNKSVVEVIVSSVKPVQLMMGKIIGIALVGLTQFMIWIFLTMALVTVIRTAILPDTGIKEITGSIPQNLMEQNQPDLVRPTDSEEIPPQIIEFTKLFDNAMNQQWGLIIFSFIFYFITGYFLYASIFAAIGSAVDNETETQQFMLPVTIPIILGLMVAMGTMQNPESSLSFWFSIIPLTSPIVMIARIPFGVPYWQIAVSMVLMIITFIAFVWMAAKVYRTGILMYGKRLRGKRYGNG